MDGQAALGLAQRLRVPTGGRRGWRLLAPGTAARVAGFLSGPDFGKVAFFETAVRIEGAAAANYDAADQAQRHAEEPTPAAGAHGGTTVSTVAMNVADGLLASGGWDRAVRVWRLPGACLGADRAGGGPRGEPRDEPGGDDFSTWRCLLELRGHQGVVFGLAWVTPAAGAARNLLSCSNDGRVICWQLDGCALGSDRLRGRALWSWKGQDAGAQVSSITAQQSADARCLLSAVKHNGLVMLWDDIACEPRASAMGGGAVPDNPPTGTLNASDSFSLGIRTAVMHPRGTAILVAGNDKAYKGWVMSLPITPKEGGKNASLSGAAPLQMVGKHEGGVRCLAATECGRFCISGAFGSKRNMLVHRLATGETERVMEGHGHSVSAMALKGDYLVTAGGDGVLRVWRWTLGACIRVLQNQPGAPLPAFRSLALTFDAGGVTIVAATEKSKAVDGCGGSLLVWRTPAAL